MATHSSTEFDLVDDFVPEGQTPSCVECRFYDDVQEAWEEYVAQPSNFGEDSTLVRFAEHDAFFAGAFALLKKAVPF